MRMIASLLLAILLSQTSTERNWFLHDLSSQKLLLFFNGSERRKSRGLSV
jgi:hypothetical protein